MSLHRPFDHVAPSLFPVSLFMLPLSSCVTHKKRGLVPVAKDLLSPFLPITASRYCVFFKDKVTERLHCLYLIVNYLYSPGLGGPHSVFATDQLSSICISANFAPCYHSCISLQMPVDRTPFAPPRSGERKHAYTWSWGIVARKFSYIHIGSNANT